MIKLTTLATLIKQYFVTNKRLPKVQLSQASDLGKTIGLLSAQANVGTADGTLVLDAVISEFEKSVTDEFISENALKSIESMSTIFTERIRKAFDDLKACREDVTALTERVSKEIATMVSSDAFLSKHQADLAGGAEPQFVAIPWDSYMCVGTEQMVVLDVNQESPRFAGKDATDVSVMNRAGLRLEMDINNGMHDFQFKTKETRDRVVNEIAAKTQLTPDVVLDALTILFSKVVAARYAKLASNTVNAMGSTSELLAKVVPVTKVVTALKEVELSPETKIAIDNNTAYVDRLAKLMAYYLIHSRRVIYADTLVLPNGQLNPDNKDAFTEAGGTMAQLAQHLKFFYQDRKLALDARGALLQTVIEARKDIAEKVENDTRDVKVRTTLAMNEINVSTLARVLQRFVLEHKNDTTGPRVLKVAPDRVNVIIDEAARTTLSGVAVEDVIYSVLFKLYYPAEFVTVLYKRLGSECMKMLASHNEISNKNLKLIEVRVVTELITEFVVKSGLAEVQPSK